MRKRRTLRVNLTEAQPAYCGTWVPDQRGVALLTTLVVMVILLGLGVSSLFLSGMNIQTTENTRSQAIARNAAETGLDVARLALQDAYRQPPHVFPSTFSVPMLAGLQYDIVPGSYAVNGDHVEVAIIGHGPNGAQFTMVAELIAQLPDGTGGSGTPGDGFPGLLSESSIELSGAASDSIQFRDVQIHGNAGVDVKGGEFQTCAVERDENGDCPGENWITLSYNGPNDEDYPISTSDGSNCVTPDTGDGGRECRSGGTKTVNPDYDTRLFRAAGSVDEDGDLVSTALFTTGSNYGRVDTLSTECQRLDTFCTSGSVSYSAESIPEGVTRIIADGDVTITGSNGNLEDVTLISTYGTVSFPDRYTITDTRVFSHGSLEFKRHFTAIGTVTLASRGNITFQGQSPLIQDNAVTFLVVAEGDIDVNGGPSGYVSGFFIAGGEISYNGSPGGTFEGGFASKGDLHFAGTARSPKFDAYLTINNPDSIEYREPDFDNPVVEIIVLR